MAKICCNRKHCSFIFIISGIMLAVAMAVCIVIGVFEKLVQDNIDKEVELKPGSESFKNWRSPSSPVYMQYFMFNVTNPRHVENGSKPIVQQLGPYSYREVRHNVPVAFNHLDDTVVFFSQKAYVFDRATSCAGCDPFIDVISTINIPLLKLSQLIVKAIERVPISFIRKEVRYLVFKYLNSKETVMEEKSVHELLWGYNDSLLLEVHNIVVSIEKKFKVKLPIDVDPLIHLQSNNTNVLSEIYTGVGDIDRLGHYASWNNLRNLKWWGTRWANMINGTDGSLFHPSVSKDDKLYCFVSDICRSMYLTFDSTVTVKGIKLYRFIAPKEIFKYTPDVRAGFCVADNRSCVQGLLDISVCQPMGVPIVVSLPHFLFGNESLRNEVEGMHPNKEDHATFISVEPNTGLTMRANKRIQINVAVKKIPEIKKLSKLREVFLPVMFVNESACISEEDADKFKKDVYLPMRIIYYGKFALIGFGCCLIIIGLLLLRFRTRRPLKVSDPTIQVNSADAPDERTPLTRPL